MASASQVAPHLQQDVQLMPLWYVSRGLRMGSVLCVALVVEVTWVKGLGGNSWSNFSLIPSILNSISIGEISEFSGSSW